MNARRTTMTGLVGAGVVALAAGLLSMGSPVAASDASTPTSPPTGRVLGAPPEVTDPPAVGVIVKTAPGAASLRAIAGKAGVAGTPAQSIAPRVRVLAFDKPLSEDAAQQVADRLAAQPGVEWAEPNRRVARIASTPAPPNDPLWPDQWDMWDSARTSGGYSVRALPAWPVTKGSPTVVVAVIDTGITVHPDLDANVVPGYDFISEVLIANDGDGWDPNPLDNGDWITEEESQSGYFEGCSPTDSSWHGTHVSGTVAAIQNDNYGITGVAPLVKLQAVRALGKCGGTEADIAAAIRWAAGDSVPGVPANATPAKVINMSLGGLSGCSAATQESIDAARQRGASVIVAAGNNYQTPVSQFTPANCEGVVRVGATDRGGIMASYSNIGDGDLALTLSAPGGDGSWFTLSTVNSGTQGPVGPTFAAYPGTSMATPHVAGAAALLYSQGVTDPDTITARLAEAVQPVYGGCPTQVCGTGILDINRLLNGGPAVSPDPIALAAPTKVKVRPDPSTRRVTLTWAQPQGAGLQAADHVIQYSVDGGSTWLTFDYVSYYEDPRPNRVTIKVWPNARFVFRVGGVVADGGIGAWSRKSAAVTFPLAVPGRIGRITTTTAPQGDTTVLGLAWRKPAGEIDGYGVRLREAGGEWSGWVTVERPRFQTAPVPRGVTYEFEVLAFNEAGSGRSRIVSVFAG